MITQSVTADERKAGTRGVILGNSRVFYTGEEKEVVVEEEADLPF